MTFTAKRQEGQEKEQPCPEQSLLHEWGQPQESRQFAIANLWGIDRNKLIGSHKMADCSDTSFER